MMEKLTENSGDYLQKKNDSYGVVIFTVKIPERVVEYVTCAIENVFGYKPDECIGKKTKIFYPSVEEYQDFGRSLESAIKEGKNDLKEERIFKRKNGEIFPCKVTITFLKDEEGIVRIISVLQDITERKQTEEELRQYEHIVSCSTDMLALLNKRFVYLAVNQAYLSAFKRDRNELIGHTVSEVFGEEFFNTFIKSNAEQALAGKEVHYQEWFKFPAYERRCMDITYYPYFDENNKVMGVVVNERNITERVLAEESLLESEKRYRSLIESTSSIIWTTDAKGGFIVPQLSWEHFTGQPWNEHKGYGWVAMLHPEDREHVRGIWKRALESQSIYETEGRVWNINLKEYRYFEVVAVPVKNSDGSVREWAGKINDITERKKTEDALRQSKGQIQSILDNTTAVIYLKDTQGKYIIINRQYQDIFHITKEEIVGKTDYDVFPEEIADAFHGNDQKVLKAQAPLEMEEVALHDDGPHTYISIKFPLFDSNGIPYGLCGISTDITERKKAEEALREQGKALEQKNVALSEILGQLEIEKKQINDNVIANAESLLLPTIQKLRLTGISRKYVQLLQKNIQELTSSFGTKLTEKSAKLTSREIEICNLIKNGLTNKEIAHLLNISLRTIERHRNNIRNKLGIVNKDVNLTSMLKTF